MDTESTDVSTHAPAVTPPPRRAFLKKALAVVVGGVVAAVPGLAGVMVFLDPVRRSRASGSRGGTPSAGKDFVDVAPLSAVPADGLPRKFQILAERVDAWNKHAAAPVGAVYLKRNADAPEKVVAFNVVCPHAGCFVEPGTEKQPGGPGGFFCPCHNSAFHPDGSIVKGQCVSPRGLDELDVDAESLKTGTIRVHFQNFVAGTHDKRPTT